MKAIPIIKESIQFRSKLEARWNYFMGDYPCHYNNDGTRDNLSFDWPIEYEPELHDIENYIPDFMIYGDLKKILVEVKPINYIEDFYKDDYKEFREKVKKTNLFEKGYHLIIVGTRINMDPDNKNLSFGIHMTENSHLDKFKYYASFCLNYESGKDGIIDPVRLENAEICENLICSKYIKFNKPILNWYQRDDLYEIMHRDGILEKWNGAASFLQWKPKK
jgi:hypothetical protein